MRSRPAPVEDHERSTNVDACREAALRLLERARRTRLDLTRRLRGKGYALPAIEETLVRLERVGLVDDVEYARAYLAGRRLRRPAGARRLEQELRAKGVDLEDVAKAQQRLAEEQGAVDEVAGARAVIAQAERRYRGLEPRARRQRLYALLGRRGFSGGVIETALRAMPADSEDSPD